MEVDTGHALKKKWETSQANHFSSKSKLGKRRRYVEVEADNGTTKEMDYPEKRKLEIRQGRRKNRESLRIPYLYDQRKNS